MNNLQQRPMAMSEVAASTALIPTNGRDATLETPAVGYRAFWEHATVGIYRMSPDGKQVRANPALVRLNGFETEEELLEAVQLLGREWYVQPGRRASFLRLMEEEGSVRDFRSEVRLYGRNERIWISENAWAVTDTDGRTLYYEGTVVDITEQMRAVEALTRSEERFRDFAETASDWFWETGPDHRFTSVSERVQAIGLSSGVQAGLRRIDVAADFDDPKWDEHIATLNRHEPFRDFRYLMQVPDSDPVWVSVSGKPVFGHDGTFLGYRGSARNITANVEAEQRLQSALKAAEDASRAKSDFLANMSHELRTPLNAIIGFAEGIKDGLLPAARSAEYARHIHDSGLHLLELINDVLDMSKITAGRMDIDREPVDIREVVERAVSMFGLRSRQTDIALKVDFAPDIPPLCGDRVRLGQILLNLISNAMKFTEPGGSVHIRVACQPDAVLIDVADSGIGMSADELATALEPFGQVRRGRERLRPHEGTGLGLSITRSLVELHGGSMTIDSAPGRGTTVRLQLPAVTPGRCP